MDRRSFLTGAGALALTQMLIGCGGQQRPTLKVRLLKNTIPAQLLGKFRQELRQSTQNFALDFKPESQLKTLFQLLETWNPQSSATASQKPWFSLPWNQKPQPQDLPDLVTLGDYWLTQAIQQQLIQPLNPANLQQWQQLPPRWRELVTHDRQGNFDPQGQVWAAPYRWGSTMIAYRIDKFKALGWTPKDWSDLWRPELRGRISLLDQPREVIGLTLKKLGHSYNTPDLGSVPDLKSELQALHQQTKFYSSKAYLQPLLLEDVWVAVGWSSDLLPIIQRVNGASPEESRQLAAVIPQSGTALWSDVWVRPVAKPNLPIVPGVSLADRWIDFCWEPQIASQLSLLSKAASPVVAEASPTDLPSALQKNSLLLPDPQVLQRSEFLQPLPEKTLEQYRALWTEIRSQQVN